MNNQKLNSNIREEDVNKASSSVMRKCCACGKIADRSEFVRILREHSSGEYIINPDNYQFGRSIYLCKNEECFKTAVKKKRFKTFTDGLLESIKEEVNK